MKLKKNKKGFTLIELLAVIVILGVLFSIAVGSYSNYQKRAKDEAIERAEDSMRSGTSNYFINCTTSYGGKDKELCRKYTMPDDVGDKTKVWLRDLVKESILDPIKNPYNTSKTCDENASYVLITNRGDSSKNLDLEYIACLVCGNYKSANSKCDWLERAP